MFYTSNQIKLINTAIHELNNSAVANRDDISDVTATVMWHVNNDPTLAGLTKLAIKEAIDHVYYKGC